MKNYNKQHLRGDMNYTDNEFAHDMAEEGIYIPDELLHTDRMVPFVTNEIYKRNVEHYKGTENPANPGRNYTEAEAQAKAEENRSVALQEYRELLKNKK